MNVSDYRSAERTFQLLAQAAGRAGRDELPGKVIIQTYQPEHYSITTAAKEDYIGFFRQEMAFRKMLKYPPQAHILAVLCIGRDEDKTGQFCEHVATTAKEFAKTKKGEYISVIGPTKASIAKSNDFYRNLIYIKADTYGILTELAEKLEPFREQDKNVILQLDFDPMGSY